MVHVVFLNPGTPAFRVGSRKISQLSCGTPRRHAPYLSFIPSDSASRPRLFPNVKEACSTAALLRTLRHRTQTSTVPMWRTIGNSRPSRILYFGEFQDFSRMHRWILNEAKYPQSFAFTHCAGYLKIAHRKQHTLLYTSEVI